MFSMSGVLFSIAIIAQTSDPDTVFSGLDSLYRRYSSVCPDTGQYDSLFVRSPVDTFEQGIDQLRISGSKDFLFDIDQGFNQGLNVDISGDVEGVQIEGSLSDKNAPSSSVRLSEVEKVRLLATTRNFSGGIGDLELILPFNVQDDIQGVQAVIHNDDQKHRLGGAYAIDRGTTEHARFQGEEGKQSPYMLGSAIVPGSERVYVARGINMPVLTARGQDYTIDYEQGILSFTNEQLITNRTRIEVEYKRVAQDYPVIYAVGEGSSSFEHAAFSGMVRRRYYDKDDPFSFTLSPSEIESLYVAGDTAHVAHTYADTSSGGDYIISGDHFEYVGPENGTHLVTFFYVGEGNGEYIYDPLIKAFSFQGSGNGNYTPTKYVPLPEQEVCYGLGSNFYGTLWLDIFASQHDKNLFSPVNDDDNTGYGLHSRINRTFSMFSVDGTYTTYDERFHAPFYQNEIDLPFQWNTDDSLRELAQGNLAITPWSFLTVRTSYGMLNREHYRKTVSVHPWSISMGYEGIDSLDTYYAGLDHRFGPLAVLSHYEHRNSSHLFDYGLSYSLSEQTQIGVHGAYDRDTLGTGITTIADLTTLPVTVSIGHRQFNDTTFIFGDARFIVAYKNLSIQGTAEQSQRYLQKRDETFVRVEQGTGDYVYDPVTNTYLERENGDYVRKVFLLDEFERVTSQRYDVETRLAVSIAEISGRFGYTDEEEYLRIDSDASVLLGQGTTTLEISGRQHLSEDSRYSLYSVYDRTRQIMLIPVMDRLSGRISIQQQLDKLDIQVSEKRQDYNGEIAYRVFENPLLKPLLGYMYSELFSEYFSDLEIRLNTLKARLLVGFIIGKKGRIELTGEVIDRLYNIKGIPYFFTAREPGGFTERLQITSNLGVGANTVFALNYSIEFPPDDDPRHNLRLQTTIRF
jgi:hypothetical protein